MTNQQLAALGLERIVEVGLAISPTTSTVAHAATSISNVLEENPETLVRIAAVGHSSTRVTVTLAVTLGTIDDIKNATPRATAAVTTLKTLVDELASYDPAFTALPAPDSVDAQIAEHIVAEESDITLATSMAALATR